VCKNRIFIGMLVMAMGICAAGCAKEEEGEALVVVSDTEEEYAYTLVEVKRGEVTLSESLTAKYVQTKEQEVSFYEGGKKIEKIYVREGDHVKVGDILAEVSIGSLEEDIARLEYEIKKKELQKGYLDAHEDFDLTSSYYSLAYYSACEEEDLEAQTERDEEIRESYKNQREDYDDELEFDRAELSKLKSQLQSSRLYATMNGMVYRVERNLEGTTSKKGEVIMTIIDGTEGIFAMEEPDYAQYFTDGQPVSLEITYSSAKGSYEVMPYQMSTWGEKQYFSVYDGPDNDGIEVDTTGTVHVTLEKKEDVLYLPNECIYVADGKTYVYVLDEQNMRNICWVETGLEGDKYTEIMSGLKEGDTVVKR